MSQVSLSTIVVSPDGERLYSFSQVARLAQTSLITIEDLVVLGAIEPVGAMLRSRDVTRVAQITRLQVDLELNLIGAAIALDMASEIAQLKAQLHAYQVALSRR